MKKIKIIGIIIVVLLASLAFVSQNITYNNKMNNEFRDTINKQKFIAQEIAKEALYIYKNKNTSIENLNEDLEIFLNNINHKNNQKIKIKSDAFYQKIKIFKKQIEVTTPYANIVLEKIIKDIYTTNLSLVVTIDKLILENKKLCKGLTYIYKNIQYGLIFILSLMFLYLLIYITKSTSNFEILINRIDNSVKSIDQIEENVEKYLENIELTKDEDLIIESLEELMNSSLKLKQLKVKLKNI